MRENERLSVYDIMNAEIKFRIFNLRTHEFEYFTLDDILNEKYILHNSIQRYDKRKSQYTGLKDKNGNDIYCGDIVESCITKIKFLVVYDSERAMFRFRDSLTTIFDGINCISVVGNIYKNPELLEKTENEEK